MLRYLLDHSITKSSTKYKFVLVAVMLSNTAQIITALSKTALKDHLSVRGIRSEWIYLKYYWENIFKYMIYYYDLYDTNLKPKFIYMHRSETCDI